MHEQVKVHEANASQDALRIACTRMNASTSTHRIPILHVPFDTQFRTSCYTRACKRLTTGVRREPGNLLCAVAHIPASFKLASARSCLIVKFSVKVLVDQLLLDVFSQSTSEGLSSPRLYCTLRSTVLLSLGATSS